MASNSKKQKSFSLSRKWIYLAIFIGILSLSSFVGVSGGIFGQSDKEKAASEAVREFTIVDHHNLNFERHLIFSALIALYN